MGAHARLSPSSAKRWFSCPAAPDREAAYPDTDSESSMLGTNTHAFLEAMLLAKDPRAVPKVLPHPHVKVDVASLLGASSCYGYVIDRAKKLKGEFFAESKADPAPLTGRNDGKGTADVTIVSKDVLEIIDYKNGGWRVEADDPQLRIYGVSKLAEHMGEDGHIPFKTVRLTVFQPKRPGELLTERFVEMTPAALLDWCLQEYIPKAAATDDPLAAGVPSDEACHFCKAHDACEERSVQIKKSLEILFPMATTPSGGDPLLSSVPVVELTNEQLSQVQDAAALVKARLKDVDAETTKRLNDRQPIAGWKLVKGSGQRQWSEDSDAMEKFFKTELKLKADQYAPRSLCSPAQLQKLGLHIKKWEQVETKITKTDGGLVLAPASDPRPDAKVSVEGLFENVADRPPEVVLPAGPFAPPVFTVPPEMVAPFDGPFAIPPHQETADAPPAMDLSFLGL